VVLLSENKYDDDDVYMFVFGHTPMSITGRELSAIPTGVINYYSVLVVRSCRSLLRYYKENDNDKNKKPSCRLDSRPYCLIAD